MTTNTTILGIIKPDNQQSQPETVVATAIDQIDKVLGGNMLKLFARKATTTGLTWAFHGGSYFSDGVLTTVSDGTVALTASTTNYVEATQAGVVSRNTTGFSANQIPLYEVVTGASTITSETDRRDWLRAPFASVLTKAMPSDANYTLTHLESRSDFIVISGGTTLTAQRDIVLPLIKSVKRVYNNSAGNRALRFIGASGTGVVVQNKQRLEIYCDGTNWLPIDSDAVSQTIAYAASIAIDASLGSANIGALTGNLTMNAPTNPRLNQHLRIVFAQDATGGRTITWNAAFKKAADGAGTANQKGATSFIYDGTDWVQVGGPLAFF